MGTKKNANAKAAKAPRLPRVAVTLNDPANNALTIVASTLKDGKFRSAVLHRVDGKSKRAMVEIHDSMDAAKARAQSLIAEASALGWIPKPRKQKTPAFVAIPKPDLTPKPKPIKPIKPAARRAAA